jgi:hypothetical protein
MDETDEIAIAWDWDSDDGDQDDVVVSSVVVFVFVFVFVVAEVRCPGLSEVSSLDPRGRLREGGPTRGCAANGDDDDA